MTAGSRPSETFGTDSRSVTDLLYGARNARATDARFRAQPIGTTRRSRRSSATSPRCRAAPRRASRSSPRPSSRAQPADARISTARHRESSRAPRAHRGGPGRSHAARAGSSSTRTTFDATFYCASVTRCYPGRASGRGDRTPTPAERRLCCTLAHRGASPSPPRRSWSRSAASPPRAIVGARTLTDCVGKSYLVDDAIAIPLPHPSGASAWLNDPINRRRLGKALTHARREIARLDDPG